MKAATIELEELRKKLENYDRDRAALSRTRSQYSVCSKQMNDLTWETEALRMRTEKLTEERNQLKKSFEDAVLELQQKTSLKNLLLERKLAIVEKDAEKRDVLLGEMLNVSGGGAKQVPHHLGEKFDQMMKVKNNKIQDLRYELARVCKAHDDLLITYEAKMVQYGIPIDELGFKPIRTTAEMKLGLGPAGLVAKKPL